VRVSKQAAAENRQRILTAAARLFREHGIDGAGVDAITEAAGLTHGAFYSQFGSKEAVVVEALRLVLDESNELWVQGASGTDKRRALETIIDGYLSPRHRTALGKGCAVAALGSDLPRQSKKVRQVFTKRLEEGLEVLAGLVPAKAASRRHDVAIQLFSTMVGALILARAVGEESLSRRILETVAKGLKGSAASRKSSYETRALLNRHQSRHRRAVGTVGH
jgi:TetR/AcrR family transcriptional regulator, transcriptional repressor for nem operon